MKNFLFTLEMHYIITLTEEIKVHKVFLVKQQKYLVKTCYGERGGGTWKSRVIEIMAHIHKISTKYNIM